MHRLALLAALACAGCIDDRGIRIGPDGDVDVGIGDGGGACLGMSGDILSFDGAVPLADREPQVVTLSAKLDCFEPRVTVEAIDLDDPDGAFSVADVQLPADLSPEDTLDVAVSLVAEAPGAYEGQLLIRAMTFEPAEFAVELFGEIPE